MLRTLLSSLATAVLLATSAGAGTSFHLSCAPENDLLRVMHDHGLEPARYASPAAAVRAAPPASAVLILADGYPDLRPIIPEGTLALARAKALRLFVEYPAALPGIELGEPVATVWERAVVSSDAFGDRLPPRTILAIHGCRHLPVAAAEPWIVVARVAGYDSAVFGLPDEAAPLLFALPERDILVATTALSRFVTGRYGPREAWTAIWGEILRWLAPDAVLPALTYVPSVRPRHAVDEPLPPDAERRAVARGGEWFHRSRLLLHESWAEEFAAKALASHVADLDPGREIGDGRLGLLEGFSAHVGPDGTQQVRTVIRNDCVNEGAMALAFHGRLTGDRRSWTAARNLCDFACFDSLIQQGIRADPAHPCFGLMSWGTTTYAWERAFYGDDNARSLLGLIAVSALMESDRWEESILRCLLANLRTTGSLGFRGNRIDIPDLERLGWRHFHDREIVNYAPHFESYLWACYLWAHRATGHAEFLRKAESAITMTMEAGEERWSWTNGVIQERARILLALAWLVRVDDTPRHRAWLASVADRLLENQVECGAIREELGDPARGVYGAITSNEAYGTTETPLIQQNGDPACDLLYTTNFAFLALHEAAAATGDPELRAAEDRLARFLCRIQIRAEDHPELDGGWFRVFDFDKWEFWGSSADVGWGAWSIESGWTQGWITAVLALRAMDTSLWELTAGVDLRDELPAVQELMARNDGAPYEPEPSPLEHLGIGAPYELVEEPSGHYPGAAGQLTDGRAWPAWSHRMWLGWQGNDLSATLDLGEVKRIRAAGVLCMRSADVGIYLPSQIRVSTSADGESFTPSRTVTIDPHVPGDRTVEAEELLVPVDADARYVRVEAISVGTIPAWHPARDREAWLFVGQLVVR